MIKKDLIKFLKNNLPEIFLLISILIFIFLLPYNTITFKQLPSLLFGGDFYYQLGQIYHIYFSPFIDWFKTSNGLGKRPGYLPIYGIFVTLFGKLFGLNPFKAMVFFNFIIYPIAFYIFYVLGSRLTNDKFIGLGTALFNSLFFPPFVFKYTEFTQLIMVPIYLLTFFNFHYEKSLKNALLLGLSGGLLLLSHVTSIIFVFVSIIFLFIFNEWKNILNINLGMFKLNYFIVIILMLLIGSIYWFEPLFIYHGVSKLKNNEWSLLDYSNLDIAIEKGIFLFKKYILSIDDFLSLLRSFIFLVGFYFLWKIKDYKHFNFLIYLFIVIFTLSFSFIVITPLLNFNMTPSYLCRIYLSPLVAIISGFSVKNRKMIILIIFIFALNLIDLKNVIDNSIYVKIAHENILEVYKSLQAYILNNTSINDVFISTNEHSFMINALTGRKLVVSRRAQNDAFMQDFDERQLDAMILLYGNNLTKKIDIIKKYNMSYFYFDENWPFVSFVFQNKQIHYADPFLVIWSSEKEKILKQNGIKYDVKIWFIDPDVRGENVKKYKLIIENPLNMDNTGLGPWKDDIDFMLEEVWNYSIGGIKIASLYKVNKNLIVT